MNSFPLPPITHNSSRAADSVVARLIVDPDFRELATSDFPAALNACRLDPKERLTLAHLDLKRVNLFAGLVVKVQHTYLWGILPTFLKLLKTKGIEIELFAEYTTTYRRSPVSRGGPSEQRTDAFVEFAVTCLSGLDARGSPGLLLDVLRYEYMLSKLRDDIGNRPPTEFLSVPRFTTPRQDDLVPIPARHFKLARLSFDVVGGVRVFGESLDVGAFVRREQFVCAAASLFREGNQGTLDVFELDAITFRLLSLIDGQHSVADIRAEWLRGSKSRELMTDALSRAFQGLIDAKLISFETVPSVARHTS